MSRGRFKKPKPLSRSTSVTLPNPSLEMEQFTMYLAAQFNRTTLFLKNETLATVIGAIDAAYKVVGAQDRIVTPGLARIIIACHQALYSSASCVARGVPLDAAAASRRALEAARTALAMKLDLTNSKKWIAFEERMLRWRARQTDQKPSNLKISYDALKGNVLADKLACLIGSLSDAAVHFTPEFFSGLDFQDRKHGKEVFSNYLEDDDLQTANHVKMLAAVRGED